MTEKRGRGRPRTRRPDLENFTTYLEPGTIARLKAVAQLKREPAYAVFEQALRDYLRSLPEGVRRRVEVRAGLGQGNDEEVDAEEADGGPDPGPPAERDDDA